MRQEIDEVHSAAQAFFTKMVEWEKRSRALFPARGAVREDLRNDLKQIFSEHLTQKAASRKHPRYVLLNHAHPPEFDRPITKVEPAEPGAYWVQVEHWLHGFTRFHYVKHSGIWKTDYYQVGLDGVDWERRFEI